MPPLLNKKVQTFDINKMKAIIKNLFINSVILLKSEMFLRVSRLRKVRKNLQILCV